MSARDEPGEHDAEQEERRQPEAKRPEHGPSLLRAQALAARAPGSPCSPRPRPSRSATRRRACGAAGARARRPCACRPRTCSPRPARAAGRASARDPRWSRSSQSRSNSFGASWISCSPTRASRRPGVDREIAVHEHRALALRAVGRRAAQDRAHARDELARVERLRHVVVGADLEADDLVDVLVARGRASAPAGRCSGGCACRPRRRRCPEASGRGRRVPASPTRRASAPRCRSRSCERCSRRSSDTRRRTTRWTPRPRRRAPSAASCHAGAYPLEPMRSVSVWHARQRDESRASFSEYLPSPVGVSGMPASWTVPLPAATRFTCGAVDEDRELPADGAEREVVAAPHLRRVAALHVAPGSRRRSPAAPRRSSGPRR